MKFLITAGPTYELIDDVRYIGNFSSGKMGCALADIALEMGHQVQLIAGPINIKTNPKIDRIDVVSAEQMFNSVKNNFKDKDVVIMSAAVSDYRPKHKHIGKIKKSSDSIILELEKTIDILEYIGNNVKSTQYLVGFALESENLIQYAKDKLRRKKCNMIVANYSNKENSGFGGDKNKVLILKDNGEIIKSDVMHKRDIAKLILKSISY